MTLTPKADKVLELCIENGVARGIRRAYKHNDAPQQEEIHSCIVEAVTQEFYEWFDIPRNS